MELRRVYELGTSAPVWSFVLMKCVCSLLVVGRIGMSLPSAPIGGLTVGALVTDLPFVNLLSQTRFCNAILQQMRSSQSQLKIFLHLSTPNGTVLFEMTAQVAGAGEGAERCVILIGREVSSGLAGLVVDQSAAAPLESAADRDDVIDETSSESAPSNVSADLAGSLGDLVVGETGSSNNFYVSNISDITLPSALDEPLTAFDEETMASTVDTASKCVSLCAIHLSVACWWGRCFAWMRRNTRA